MISFRIGQRITGFLDADESGNRFPFTGHIVGFAPENKARVKIHGTKHYGVTNLDTCHPMDVDKIKHSKKTFISAAIRVSPSLHFKSDADQRNFLEKFWKELQDFTEDED